MTIYAKLSFGKHSVEVLAKSEASLESMIAEYAMERGCSKREVLIEKLNKNGKDHGIGEAFYS
jgi:RecA-family ATPase